MKALDGKLVLDLTRLLPGALVTQNLASFGAEVWKVEAPGRGDYARDMPPLINGIGAYFLLSNSGKKSLALDLKRDEGKGVFVRLVSKADVLIESYRPGVMDALGLGYEQLLRFNPRLIYAALTGYGQDGPYAQKPGHDLNYAALGGLLHTANASKPHPLGVQLADVTGAQHALIGILLALLARDTTGQGQKIDVSMLESILPLLTVPLAEYAATGCSEGTGVLSGRYACYNIYQVADGGFLALGALEPKFWSAFCIAIRCEELVPDQFTEDRQPELIARVSERLHRRTAEQWLESFKDVDTCISAVNDIPQVVHDPHLIVRQAFGVCESVPVQRLDVSPKLSRTPGTPGSCPPRLGEHTWEILIKAGLSEEELRRLAQQEIIQLTHLDGSGQSSHF